MSAALSRYAKLGGNQGGILPGMLVSVAKVAGEPYLRSATVAMPQYHRFALNDPHMEMQYHLAGYGSTNEEAVTRLTGESVERYAAMMAMKVHESKVECASYGTLSSRNPCMPLEYLGLFDTEQQAQLSRMLPQFSPTRPSEDDVIAWLPCPSLIRPGQVVYVPAQLMFLGFRPNAETGDKLYTPSFSTGTAAHVTLEQALLNALIEAVQIDAFIVNWYTSASVPRIELDNRAWSLLEQAGLRRSGPYEVQATYLSLPDLPLPNIGVTLVRKEKRLPWIAFGLQADCNVDAALARGGAEAAAILGIGMFSTIFDLPRVHFAENGSAFTDLDTNVLYYASPRSSEEKLKVVRSRVSGAVPFGSLHSMADDIDGAIGSLLTMVASVSEWATYLDITPPELADTPWRVVRILVPELLSMCLPGFPARVHPRMLAHGGVSNAAPHPLP